MTVQLSMGVTIRN